MSDKLQGAARRPYDDAEDRSGNDVRTQRDDEDDRKLDLAKRRQRTRQL